GPHALPAAATCADRDHRPDGEDLLRLHAPPGLLRAAAALFRRSLAVVWLDLPRGHAAAPSRAAPLQARCPGHPDPVPLGARRLRHRGRHVAQEAPARVNEPTTVLTDYALAAVLIFLGSKLFGTSKLWAVAFLALGLGALLGGTWH